MASKNEQFIKLRLYIDDSPTFEGLNAAESDPLDLTDTIESRGSAGRAFIEYALSFTKRNFKTIVAVLKKLIPSLRREVRFQVGDQTYRVTNFSNVDEIIRMHGAFLEQTAAHQKSRRRPRPKRSK
jgi:hypothetical protein